MEIAVLVSSLIANIITQITKPDSHSFFTDIEERERLAMVRGANAVAGILLLALTSWVMGEPLTDVESLRGFVESLGAVVATFLTSQGGYFLMKK